MTRSFASMLALLLGVVAIVGGDERLAADLGRAAGSLGRGGGGRRRRAPARGDRLEPDRRPRRRTGVRDRCGVGPQADRDEPGPDERLRAARVPPRPDLRVRAGHARRRARRRRRARPRRSRSSRRPAGSGPTTWLIARDEDEARGATGEVSLIGGGLHPSARLPLLLHPGHALALALALTRGCDPDAPRHLGQVVILGLGMTVDDLRLADFRPRSSLRVPVHEVRRPKFPVIDAHNHLGSAFGGEWAARPPARADRGARRVGRRDGRRSRRRPGRRASRPRSTAGRRPYPDRVAVFAGLDYASWARPRVRGDRGEPTAGFRGARRARPQGLEAARLAGARSRRPARRGRRRLLAEHFATHTAARWAATWPASRPRPTRCWRPTPGPATSASCRTWCGGRSPCRRTR